MPMIKHYVVEQVRQVEVDANNEAEALAIASSAFTYGQTIDNTLIPDHAPVGIWGNTTGPMRTTEIHIRETGR